MWGKCAIFDQYLAIYQNRYNIYAHIFTIESTYEVVSDLSNGGTENDLE